MSISLAPPRGTIDFTMPEYAERTKFFNMYDSLATLRAFEPVEVVGYPDHCVDLVKIDGTGGWTTAADDDELLLVVMASVTVLFRAGQRQVASATAVDGEVLLLPRALDYQISSAGGGAALCLHFRARQGGAA